jgi:hypothetical protein
MNTQEPNEKSTNASRSESKPAADWLDQVLAVYRAATDDPWAAAEPIAVPPDLGARIDAVAAITMTGVQMKRASLCLAEAPDACLLSVAGYVVALAKEAGVAAERLAGWLGAVTGIREPGCLDEADETPLVQLAGVLGLGRETLICRVGNAIAERFGLDLPRVAIRARAEQSRHGGSGTAAYLRELTAELAAHTRAREEFVRRRHAIERLWAESEAVD